MGGVCEHIIEFADILDEDKVAELFIKTGQIILRVDQSLDIAKYKIEKGLIDKISPIILAASQDHLFGVNNSEKFKRKINVNKRKREIHEWFKHSAIRIFPTYRTVKQLQSDIYWANMQIGELKEYLARTELEYFASKYRDEKNF